MARSRGVPSASSATPRSISRGPASISSRGGSQLDVGERYLRSGAQTPSSQSNPAGCESNRLRGTASNYNKNRQDHIESPHSSKCGRATGKCDADSTSSVYTKAHGKLKLNLQDKKSRALSPSQGHASGCICELCNCGQHHCPLKKKQAIMAKNPFLGKSGYREDYHAYGTNELQPNPPVQKNARSKLWDTDGHTGQSHYKTDYLRYPEKDFRPDMQHRKQELSKTKVPFEGISAYRADYTEKHADRFVRTPQPKSQWTPGGEKLEGTTTNRADFNIKKLPLYTPPKRESIRKDAVPFQGSSEYHDRYPRHKISPVVQNRGNFQGGRALWVGDGSNDYSTSYRDTHNEKPLQAPIRKSVKEYKPSNLPTGTTTNRAEFIKHDVGRTASCPAVKRDTQPWGREGRGAYVTEAQATIGEAGRCVTNCPAAVLTSKYEMCKIPSSRSHIYFDDRAKCWY